MSELNLNDIEDRFFVRGRMQILHVLNELIHRREPVTVHFPTAGGNLGHLDIQLLDARDHQLIFETNENTSAEQQLLSSRDCAFVSRPDGIRVQFSAHMVQQVDWGGSKAFAIPLPENLARLQRQETFRIRIPADKMLTVRLLDKDGVNLSDWPLHDLSAGGLGISVKRDTSVDQMSRIARVSFLLPDFGLVDCAVELRHATGAIEGGNNGRYRVGVSFIGMALETRVAIQRYVVHLEHERRSSLRDHESDVHH
ncbi:MAG: flagellar brake protein [Proteobacteria bacterium]|nr:flagellar brake protein [Pseudomonadota bacterium]